MVLLCLLLVSCSPRKKVVQSHQQRLEQQSAERVAVDSLRLAEQGDERELLEVEWWGVPLGELVTDSVPQPQRPLERGGYRVVKVKQKQAGVVGAAVTTHVESATEVVRLEKGKEMRRRDPPRGLYWSLLLLALLVGLFCRKIWALRAIP